MTKREPHSGRPIPSLTEQETASIRKLLSRGLKIEAIKYLRDRRGCPVLSLPDAVTMVETVSL
jgi:hypothetical protein